LNDEPEHPPVEVFEEQPEELHQFDEPNPDTPVAIELPDPKAVTVPQVRLAPLTSAELEHIADQRLDDAYEEKLSFTGDHLLPIPTAGKLAEAFSQTSQNRVPTAHANRYSAAATAPAIDVSTLVPDHVREPKDVEIPTLSADPTDDELRVYAEAHPAVRRAQRVFQAKVIDIERT